jgi:hypothetical protein
MTTPGEAPPSGAPDGPPPEDVSATPAKPTRTKLFSASRIVILVVLMLCLTPVLARLPAEHAVTLVLPDAATVTEVAVEWSDAETGAALHSASWHFAEGSAPRRLRLKLDVAPGRYRASIRLARSADVTSVVREVEIRRDDSALTVDLE